ncbi:hypothetical protein IAT38_003600 [Cryptococcus sp. DSM 104549]
MRLSTNPTKNNHSPSPLQRPGDDSAEGKICVKTPASPKPTTSVTGVEHVMELPSSSQSKVTDLVPARVNKMHPLQPKNLNVMDALSLATTEGSAFPSERVAPAQSSSVKNPAVIPSQLARKGVKSNESKNIDIQPTCGEAGKQGTPELGAHSASVTSATEHASETSAVASLRQLSTNTSGAPDASDAPEAPGAPDSPKGLADNEVYAIASTMALEHNADQQDITKADPQASAASTLESEDAEGNVDSQGSGHPHAPASHRVVISDHLASDTPDAGVDVDAGSFTVRRGYGLAGVNGLLDAFCMRSPESVLGAWVSEASGGIRHGALSGNLSGIREIVVILEEGDYSWRAPGSLVKDERLFELGEALRTAGATAQHTSSPLRLHQLSFLFGSAPRPPNKRRRPEAVLSEACRRWFMGCVCAITAPDKVFHCLTVTAEGARAGSGQLGSLAFAAFHIPQEVHGHSYQDAAGHWNLPMPTWGAKLFINAGSCPTMGAAVTFAEMAVGKYFPEERTTKSRREYCTIASADSRTKKEDTSLIFRFGIEWKLDPGAPSTLANGTGKAKRAKSGPGKSTSGSLVKLGGVSAADTEAISRLSRAATSSPSAWGEADVQHVILAMLQARIPRRLHSRVKVEVMPYDPATFTTALVVARSPSIPVTV